MTDEKDLKKFLELNLSAGYEQIETLVDYVVNNYGHSDMVFAFAYSAAAQVFRDKPKDEAVRIVTEAFAGTVTELMCYGPYYGDEEFGGKVSNEQKAEVIAALQEAVERRKKYFRGIYTTESPPAV